MNRLISLLVAAAIGVVVPANAGSVPVEQGERPAVNETRHDRGIVFQSTDSRLTLLVNSRPLRYAIGRTTLILVNGRGGSLQDVRPGYIAEVISVRRDGQSHARVIDAFSAR
jgi:hypothetical protein